MDLTQTLQDTLNSNIAENMSNTASNISSMSFSDMALKGGWIMIPILILFILAVYIFVNKLISLQTAAKENPDFMKKIKDYIYEDQIDSAINLCKKESNPSAKMIEKGISRIGKPLNDVQVAIENVGNLEVAKLEKGLSLLASVSGGAPMIGFFGTVLGMIQAFFDMANAGSNVDITILSSGIYTAMITTLAGLFVGICAFFAYNYLVTKVNNIVNKMESKTMEFMDMLNEPVKK